MEDMEAHYNKKLETRLYDHSQNVNTKQKYPSLEEQTQNNSKQKYPQLEDQTQNKQGQYEELDRNNYNIRKASHPFGVLFTILFKIIAVASYFFLNMFLSDVMTYIAIILSCAFDFWTVKNVTGRLLVGLKWYSVFQEDGTEIWKFQSYNYKHEINVVDKSFFWSSQILLTGVWAVLGVLNLMTFSFKSFILNAIGFVLASTNLWGYYKCSKGIINNIIYKEHQSKIKNLQSHFLQEGAKMAIRQQFK